MMFHGVFLMVSKIVSPIMKRPLRSFIFKAKVLKLCGLSTTFTVPVVQENSPRDNSRKTVFSEGIDFSHRALIQQACSSSVNSTSELLTQILIAIVDSASKYKSCMNDLMNDLERDIELIGYDVVNSKTEDDLMAARVKAKKLKEEFVELITLSENIEKLATATAEISFLVGAETLAILVSERLYSIQQKIRNETEDVKKIESKYLEIQRSSIIKKDYTSNSEPAHSLIDGDV